MFTRANGPKTLDQRIDRGLSDRPERIGRYYTQGLGIVIEHAEQFRNCIGCPFSQFCQLADRSKAFRQRSIPPNFTNET